MLSNRNNPQEVEHPMYSRSVHLARKMAGAANIKGRFRKTTRQYSGLMRAAPGTERYRLTELLRRLNRDMNSASVSLLSTRKRGKKEKQTRGNAHYYSCPLSCWCTAYCPEVRNTVHLPISHWNCLCAGTDGSLWGDWADAVSAMLLRWNGSRKSMSPNTQLLSWTVTLHPDLTTTNKQSLIPVKLHCCRYYFCLSK